MPQTTQPSMIALSELLTEQNVRLQRLEEQLEQIRAVVDDLHGHLIDVRRQSASGTSVVRRMEERVDRRLREEIGMLDKRIAGLESSRRR